MYFKADPSCLAYAEKFFAILKVLLIFFVCYQVYMCSKTIKKPG